MKGVPTMKQQGFTDFEMVITIVCILILALIALPNFIGDANGMELQKYMAADDATIKEVAQAMRNDQEQTVVVMSYAVTWNYDKADEVIDKSTAVQAKLIKLGVAKYRIVIGMANKGGLEMEGSSLPPADGVYLYLE
jgi:type II secretory pathway pseudopilin PulG